MDNWGSFKVIGSLIILFYVKNIIIYRYFREIVLILEFFLFFVVMIENIIVEKSVILSDDSFRVFVVYILLYKGYNNF